MTAHKHTALMLQYAQDWAETDTPWKRWEVAAPGDKFVSLSSHPYWGEEYEYRRKPQTLTYTVTMPEPMREAPPMHTEYYVVSLYEPGGYDVADWEGSHAERTWLKRGLCFATKEDAIAAAKAMLPFKGDVA